MEVRYQLRYSPACPKRGNSGILANALRRCEIAPAVGLQLGGGPALGPDHRGPAAVVQHAEGAGELGRPAQEPAQRELERGAVGHDDAGLTGAECLELL